MSAQPLPENAHLIDTNALRDVHTSLLQARLTLAQNITDAGYTDPEKVRQQTLAALKVLAEATDKIAAVREMLKF